MARTWLTLPSALVVGLWATGAAAAPQCPAGQAASETQPVVDRTFATGEGLTAVDDVLRQRGVERSFWDCRTVAIADDGPCAREIGGDTRQCSWTEGGADAGGFATTYTAVFGPVRVDHQCTRGLRHPVVARSYFCRPATDAIVASEPEDANDCQTLRRVSDGYRTRPVPRAGLTELATLSEALTRDGFVVRDVSGDTPLGIDGACDGTPFRKSFEACRSAGADETLVSVSYAQDAYGRVCDGTARFRALSTYVPPTATQPPLQDNTP